jgi:hypothetical protein
MLINEKSKHVIIDLKWFCDVIQTIKSNTDQHVVVKEHPNKKTIKRLRKALDDENIPIWQTETLRRSLGSLINENMVFIYAHLRFI